MSDLNSKRFTLRRPPKLATISRKSMDELEFVKELLARLPTRRDQALILARDAEQLQREAVLPLGTALNQYRADFPWTLVGYLMGGLALCLGVAGLG